MMRSRRQNLPAALLGCLAFLLCLAGNASAAFDHSSQNIASGDFFWAADYASENPPEPLINSRERVHCGWKTASDALEGPNEYTYVRQNPWSSFDPLGLAEENVHIQKWRKRSENAANPFSWAGSTCMLIGECLNPFRSDSNIRKGGDEMQKNMAIGRKELEKAPPVFKQIGQFTLGVGDAANPVSWASGAGQAGDSYNEVGAVETGKRMVKGTIAHAKENPFEFGGNILVPSVLGKGKMSPSGQSAKSISLTTTDGFLLKGFDMKAPFDIPAQRFGNMSAGGSDFWGLRIGTGKFANEAFAAIKPEWNNLTQYTTGVIPKGTPVKAGIIGPQGVKYPGGSLQFITESKKVEKQKTEIIPRKKDDE